MKIVVYLNGQDVANVIADDPDVEILIIQLNPHPAEQLFELNDKVVGEAYYCTHATPDRLEVLNVLMARMSNWFTDKVNAFHREPLREALKDK